MHGYTLQTPTTHDKTHKQGEMCNEKQRWTSRTENPCVRRFILKCHATDSCIYVTLKSRRHTLMTCNTLLRSATHTHTQCTHAFGTPILNTYQEYKSKTWKCLTESDSQLPLPALPHRQTGKFLKANSSQTQTIIQNAQGNKHTAAAELRWVSKKISGNIKERHVCANLHWFYYFAEIIIFAHQTLKLEWWKTSKEKILRPDVWNRIFG